MNSNTPQDDQGHGTSGEQISKTGEKVYRCGTLTYTKPALVILFAWLLWGDIVYTIMEHVADPIMQLRFKKMGAMNWQMVLLTSTIPMCLYSFFGPVISIKSDRFRSRLGRRIPFLLFSVPALAVGLTGLAFADRLGHWLHDTLNIASLSENTTVMLTMGFMLIVFAFFNVFTTTVFWYLFNDVVPENMLARFMSWFRFISAISTAAYNLFVFPYSESHATEIFLGAAVLYLIGFGLMCLNVREGKYPPPSEHADGKKGPLAAITTYAKECHSHKIYRYLWICTFIAYIGAGVGSFSLYFRQSIGLDLLQIGKINTAMQIELAVLILASGWLGDRFGPIRVVLIAQILSLLTVVPASFLWIFWQPGPDATWTIHLPFLNHVPLMTSFASFEIKQVFLAMLCITLGIAAPVGALSSMWDPPMLMRTFPRLRYGQFCSTNALYRIAGGLLGGFLAGLYFDMITPIVGKDRAYAFGPLWSICFTLPSFFMFLKFYREWKKLGGEHYVPPMLEEHAAAEASFTAQAKTEVAAGQHDV